MESDSRFNQFDHKFFGISDSEVEQMDPQQKQLLQCTYRALEDAGVPMEDASGTRTGVFFGTVTFQKDQIRSLKISNLHVIPASCLWPEVFIAFLLQV